MSQPAMLAGTKITAIAQRHSVQSQAPLINHGAGVSATHRWQLVPNAPLMDLSNLLKLAPIRYFSV